MKNTPNHKPSVLLIHPPVAKPCEPSAGVARLAGTLQAAGIDCRVYDASLDGLLGLLERPPAASDTWSRRAGRHREAHLAGLRSEALYRNRDRYKRAVMDINRLLQTAGRPAGAAVSLSNFSAERLSPLRSGDLLQAAEDFRANPFYAVFAERLAQLLSAGEPAIVGLSVHFLSQALCAFAIAGWLRARLPGVRIVLGGGLVTSWTHIPGFGNPFQGLVDDLVAGPGEAALLAMCGAEPAGAPPGTGEAFAAFDGDAYLAPGRVAPYSTSRGCYWRKCAFCPEQFEQSAYRPKAPKAVAADLQALAAAYRPRMVHFLDNALAPRLMAHLSAHPPGVPWYGFARISRHLADPDFARGLRAAGCVMLKLGVESGDQAVLDALGKGVTLATVSAALKALKAAGIATYVYLLFGTPAETPQAARRTLAFTLAHAAAIDFLNLAVFNLPAYSDEAALLETRPFYDGDLSLYRDFVHPAGWQREQVRRFLSREFRRPAPIREILAADPPFFTSNHAPFFALFKGEARERRP
jgi:hypothetical protein